MNWSNLVYLGLGLGLGVTSRWLFGRSKEPSNSLPAVQEDKQDAPELLQELKQTQLAYQMAQQMSLFKAGFLARTSHELRSPLNGLINLHQLILSDLCEDPAEEREFIAQAHDRALKLVKLTDEILNVARTEYGTNRLELQPLQLAQVLQDVYQLTHLLAANRNFPLLLSPPSTEIYVMADPRWLRQVLVNLVNTAIIQMEEGSIHISSQPSSVDKSVYICLDLPLNPSVWSEPVNLIKSEDTSNQTNNENTASSQGMRLLLDQTVLEVMQGKLEIVPVLPIDESSEHLTRLQVSIPLVSPETEFAVQEGNQD